MKDVPNLSTDELGELFAVRSLWTRFENVCLEGFDEGSPLAHRSEARTLLETYARTLASVFPDVLEAHDPPTSPAFERYASHVEDPETTVSRALSGLQAPDVFRVLGLDTSSDPDDVLSTVLEVVDMEVSGASRSLSSRERGTRNHLLAKADLAGLREAKSALTTHVLRRDPSLDEALSDLEDRADRRRRNAGLVTGHEANHGTDRETVYQERAASTLEDVADKVRSRRDST